MNRTTSLKSNPSLPENVKVLYHGTRGEAGQHIAEGGWLEPGHTQREKYERLDTNLKPLEGRVYVARDPRLVLEYALSQFGRAAGGWIFEVSADGTGTDVLIDEDDLAEMVLDGRAPENLRNFAKRIASERLWFEAENRERPALAKLGKMMIARGVLKSGRDRSRIMEKATHFAVARPMRVLRAWKLTSDFSAKDPNVSPLRWSGMVEVPVGHKAMKNPARKNATTNKATFTGWTCVSGPAELVDYLVDHGTQVSYTEFARNVDLASLGIKGLRSDKTVTFLKTSLPSGGDAWVLQWSGIEHLFAEDSVDTGEEGSRAIVLAYNEHEMPIVWEEDEAMVQALGGRALMDEKYEVMVRTNDHFDHEAYQWVMRTMAWLVPQGNVRATGLPLLQRDPLNWTKPVRRNPPKENPVAGISPGRLFHGTNNDEVGQRILAEGFVAPPAPEQLTKKYGKHSHQRPVSGNTYVTRSPRYALIYALGANMAGEKDLLQHLLGRDPKTTQHGWIFEVQPEPSARVSIDEDIIGEWAAEGKFGLDKEGQQVGQVRPGGFETLWQRAKFGYAAAQSALGKRLVKSLPEARMAELVEHASNLTVSGPVKVVRAWRVDKSKSRHMGPSSGDILSNVPGIVEWPVGHAEKPMKNPAPGPDENLLLPANQLQGLGKEKTTRIGSDVLLHKDQFGSHRFVLLGENGEPVAALQVVRPESGKSFIANVYTRPEHRRKGHASRLLEVARKKLGKVEHAKHLSEDGAAWAAARNPGHHPNRSGQSFFLRFGAWNAEERSTNFASGDVESGVSVYGKVLKTDAGWEIEGLDLDRADDPEDAEQGLFDRLNEAKGLEDAGEDNEARLVTGTIVGMGHDGEWLLRGVEEVSRVSVYELSCAAHGWNGFGTKRNPSRKSRTGLVTLYHGTPKDFGEDGAAWAAARNPVASAVGKLGPGDRLSDLMGDELVYAYRWVPDYAEDTIRPGDYVLLDPEEGRGYGGPRGKRLTVRVSSKLLEYRQGDEYVYRGEAPKRANVSRDVRRPELVTLYHGTSSEYAEDIRVRGLVAVDDGQQPVVYLAVDQQEAASWAAMRVDNMAWRKVPHGHPIVVKVRVPKKNLKPGATDAHYKHVGDIAPDQIVGVYTVAENPARKTPTSPVVLYHGTPKDFDELTLKSGGVLWLTDNRSAAEQYVSGHAYAEQSGFLWTVTLKPGARIVNLSDLSIPVVREIYEGVSDARRSTFGPIAPDQWSSFADFGLLEAKPWIVSRLKAARYDAVIVKDALQSTGIPHRSFALLRLSAVQSASREPIAIERGETIGSIEERIAGGARNNPARKRKTDDARPIERAQDIEDAVEYYRESYEVHGKNLCFKLKRTRMSVREILTWDDYSAWGEMQPGDLVAEGDSDRAILEALAGFRGEEWARRAIGWIKGGRNRIPPVVLVDGKLGQCIGDGRGRVNLAVGIGIENLDVIILKQAKSGMCFDAPKRNPARKRKTDDARFGDVHVVDYFRAGSPKAMEALGGDFADVDCVRCGSKISHVFMTQHGPMGGDCLATLTGDDSTRKAIRAAIEKLKWSKLSVDHYGGRLQKVVIDQSTQPSDRGQCSVWSVAFYFDTGRTSERCVHVAPKGSVGLTAAVVGWAEEHQLPIEARGPVQGMEQAR